MREMLSALQWQALRVRLRNTRNTCARQEPAAILEAVFKHARGKHSSGAKEPFVFHSVSEGLGRRIERGAVYELDVVFPHATAAWVEGFALALRHHLADPRNNFALLSASSPRNRSLESLIIEAASIPESATEICLDFQQPFPFRPTYPERRWWIDGPHLAGILGRRVQSLYGVDLPDLADLGCRIEILPWHWKYEERTRPSASTGQLQDVKGTVGPLYLRGDLAPLLPLLLVCSELHAGEGDPLTFGRGRFLVVHRRPCLDEQLVDPQRFSSFLDS